MLGLRKMVPAALFAGAATLFAVTSTEAGMWGRSLFDFAPECFIADPKTPDEGVGSIDAGPNDGAGRPVFDINGGSLVGNVVVRPVRYGFSRDGFVPRYRLPSTIREWLPSLKCARPK